MYTRKASWGKFSAISVIALGLSGCTPEAIDGYFTVTKNPEPAPASVHPAAGNPTSDGPSTQDPGSHDSGDTTVADNPVVDPPTTDPGAGSGTGSGSGSGTGTSTDTGSGTGMTSGSGTSGSGDSTPVVVSTPTPTATPTPTPTVIAGDPPTSGTGSGTGTGTSGDGSGTTTMPPNADCGKTCALPHGKGVYTCDANQQNPVCVLAQCDTDYVPENGICVASSSSSGTSNQAYACSSYTKLSLDAASGFLVIAGTDRKVPARDSGSSGACYYFPIAEPSPAITGKSSLNTVRDGSVVARNHMVDAGNSSYVWNPFLMNKTIVKTILAGERTLVISGGKTNSDGTFAPDAPDVTGLAVDNFFLVGAYPTAATLTSDLLPTYYSSYGTADSTVAVGGTATGGIAFNPNGLTLTTDGTFTLNNKSVSYSKTGVASASPFGIIKLKSLADGGTAHVPKIDLSNYVKPDVDTTIDFRAIDCGGSRYLNNVYLIIQ